MRVEEAVLEARRALLSQLDEVLRLALRDTFAKDWRLRGGELLQAYLSKSDKK